MVAGRFGAKRSILVGVAVYAGISVLGYFMTTGTHFILLAILVGMVQGGTQALSRSLFATMIPKYKSGEFFGFFGVVDKFAGAIGMSLMWVMAMVTGETRWGILGVITLFILGAILLKMVQVKEGQQIAREAETQAAIPAENSAPAPPR
jgi:MFS transporter, UMF1 family